MAEPEICVASLSLCVCVHLRPCTQVHRGKTHALLLTNPLDTDGIFKNHPVCMQTHIMQALR